MELNVNTCPGGKRAFTRSLPAISFCKNGLRFNQRASELLSFKDKSISRLSFKTDGNILKMKWDLRHGFPIVFRKTDNVYSIHNKELGAHLARFFSNEKGLILIGDFKDGYYNLTWL